MIRLGLLLLAGLLLGGVVHFATVIVLPRTATQDAYARLSPITPGPTICWESWPRIANGIMRPSSCFAALSL